MTVNLKLSEVIIDAIIAKLQAGLPDRLATINAQYADGITNDTPGADDYYPFGMSSGIANSYPAIVVTETASPEYETESPHSLVYVAEIMVVGYEQDPDRQTLGRKLLRLRRAITEVLWDDPPRESLTGSAFHLKPVRHQPGPTFSPDTETSTYRSLYIQFFRARQFEGA